MKVSLSALEHARDRASRMPWEFQHWGPQNQNGDYTESILFDAHGSSLVYGLADADGEYVIRATEALPHLMKASKDMLSLADRFDRLAERHPNSETSDVERAVANEIRATITAAGIED